MHYKEARTPQLLPRLKRQSDNAGFGSLSASRTCVFSAAAIPNTVQTQAQLSSHRAVRLHNSQTIVAALHAAWKIFYQKTNFHANAAVTENGQDANRTSITIDVGCNSVADIAHAHYREMEAEPWLDLLAGKTPRQPTAADLSDFGDEANFSPMTLTTATQGYDCANQDRRAIT